ncbi:unnamed protein product [Lupinus luteus]|uniref:Uncharacterized protein n=1 Tax=Lupinus luteus TaxID=3873 RepID=A0AAV1WV69_LUPLU
MNILSPPQLHINKSYHFTHRHGTFKKQFHSNRNMNVPQRRSSFTVLCNSKPNEDDFASRVLKENPSQVNPS